MLPGRGIYFTEESCEWPQKVSCGEWNGHKISGKTIASAGDPIVAIHEPHYDLHHTVRKKEHSEVSEFSFIGCSKPD